MRQHVEVSSEMVTYVGSGVVDAGLWPSKPVALAFRTVAPAAWHFTRFPDWRTRWSDDQQILLLVSESACERIFGFVPEADCAFHLPPELAAIALSIRENGLPAPLRETLRLAKSIELLCETWRALAAGSLVPLAAGIKSRADAERILAARQMIDEHWQEKLTLDSIARACGINRAKLTRGFRDMFDCTIADAIAGRRLQQARQMLLATDLPVATIGYRCGYENNASFSRAFQRRTGVAPTRFRALQIAA
jgi:AraC family transcriptional regulator, transcriptional activator of the genes for pyochelin and ferripyochelin receptors